jgi:hypothetical protein
MLHPPHTIIDLLDWFIELLLGVVVMLSSKWNYNKAHDL